MSVAQSEVREINVPTPLSKPTELTALHLPSEGLFETLQKAFDVPATFELQLHHVDAARDELEDQTAVAALAMRKVQALRLAAEAGYPTATDVVVGLAAELHRFLEELAAGLLVHGGDEARAHARILLDWRYKIDRAARCVGMLNGNDDNDSIVVLV